MGRGGGGAPRASRTFWRVSGRPDCWISSDVDLGSVTQQSISEFAMVKVFAKLPNNSTFAATRQMLLRQDG